jgi:hypothetical protein
LVVNGRIHVDPQVLVSAADGINKIIHQLQSLGFAASGSIGRGFTQLELSGLHIGPAGLKSAFDGFCDRWEWGVRALVRDANALAKDIGLAAGAYYEQDRFSANALRRWENALVGDPRLSQATLAGMSYSDILRAGAAYENPAHADFSAASFDRAAHNSVHSVADAFHQSWTERALSGQNPVTGKDL